MELAAQYIKENPFDRYIANCPVYTINCVIPITNTNTSTNSNTNTITVYWDLSYGPLYICKSSIDETANYTIKKLYGPGRTCSADLAYPESVFNCPKQIHECYLKFVDINTVPTYIMIHSIASGYDSMHNMYSDTYDLWDINGNMLLAITLELHNLNSKINWYFTEDNKWIIIWDNEKFQPIIINVDELITNQKEINYEYALRIDRMDWVYTVSPFTVMGMYYNDNVLHVSFSNRHIESKNKINILDYKSIGIVYDLDTDVRDTPPLTYCKSIEIDLTTRKICNAKV